MVPNVPSLVRVRPFNFIRGLSRDHEVTLLCLSRNWADDQFITELRRYCQELEIIRLSLGRSLWNCFTALFSSEPLRCAYFYSPVLRSRIKAKVEQGEFDLLHAEHLKSVPMLEDVIGRIPIVFDAVDCISMFEARRRGVVRNPFVKLFSSLEFRRMIHWESKAAHLADCVVISSPIDKQQYPLSAALDKKFEVIPNGVDLEYFDLSPDQMDTKSLVFCAKLDYFPNEDAALYFANSVWPILRKRRPELRFDIVGSRPPQTVKQLNGRNNIRVVGSVPDVRPYLRSASVALCPIRLRAGVQNKILEAMALGVPVVATRICCPGLAVEPGKHLLVADTPEEFACAVELVLDNPALRANLIRAGRKYVESTHDWAECVRALSAVYDHARVDFNASRGVFTFSQCSPVNPR